jgi:DNA-binding XRE family transcriptional regulator
MLAVVKTPLTKIRIKGRVPNKLIDLLAEEYGNALRITPDPEDEKLDVFQTDWYKNLKKRLSPGSYIKVFRQNRNMTQTELGKALGGMPRQHISNMENGIRPISKKTALRLAKLFDVSVEKFIS